MSAVRPDVTAKIENQRYEMIRANIPARTVLELAEALGADTEERALQRIATLTLALEWGLL